MRRGAGWLALALAALAVAGVQAQAEGDVERGSQLYLENCAVCHGADGQGRIGASLDGFPGIQVDALMSQTIREGIAGSVMPAWGTSFGGPLADQDVADIVGYITEVFDGTEPVAPLPNYEPPDIPPLPDVTGDPSTGAVVYRLNCTACHGDQGQGRFGKPLAKAWPGIQPEVFVSQVIREGVSGTTMPAWESAQGGPLSDDEVVDVTAYVLSLPPVVTSATPPALPVEGPITGATVLIILAAVGVVGIVVLVSYYRRA